MAGASHEAGAAKTTALAALVETIIAEDPYETADGLKWAARPLAFYADILSVSTKTITRLTKAGPFVSKHKLKDGGGLLLLLRIGPKVQDADDWRRIMSKAWRNWQDNAPAWALTKPQAEGKKDEFVSLKEGSCLWGLAQDLPGELALALLKYAISSQDRWANVAKAMKLAAESKPGYKLRYWSFPHVCTLRHFYRGALNAYVIDVQAGKIELPSEWKALHKPAVSAALLQLTDPLDPTPDTATEEARRAALREFLAKIAAA
jgi:hypothetical protein